MNSQFACKFYKKLLVALSLHNYYQYNAHAVSTGANIVSSTPSPSVATEKSLVLPVASTIVMIVLIFIIAAVILIIILQIKKSKRKKL